MEPFFPTTCGPKNSPATLDRNAPAHVQEQRMPLQKPTPCPQFQCCWKQPQQSHNPNRKAPPTSEKPIHVHNTEIRRGAGRPVIQSDLLYNVCPSLLQHCLIVIQSVQARECFLNQETVANFNLLDMKLMKNGPSRIWK